MYTYAERAAAQTVRAKELAAALEGKLRRLQTRHGENLSIIGPDGPNRLLTIRVDNSLKQGNIHVAYGSWTSPPAKDAQFDLRHSSPAVVDDLEKLLATVISLV